MTKENLLADLAQSTQKLADVLSHFTAGQFNERPSESEWSAAQIADHVTKVYFSIIKAMTGDTIPTNRPPEQKIALLRQAMEDDTTRRVAPERVRPSEETGECLLLVQRLRSLEEKLKNIVEESDMTEACVSFKHPALGTMTKMEWVAFNNYHTERHIKQAEHLLRKIAT